eukprot:5674301-Ditylum_brightwellii.AAC.1
MSNITELSKDLAAGVNAIARVANSTWWEWTEGSTLFFWRWVKSFQQKARGVSPLFVHDDLLSPFWILSRLSADLKNKDQLKKKLSSAVGKHYIKGGFVKSLIGYFGIPNGVSDI